MRRARGNTLCGAVLVVAALCLRSAPLAAQSAGEEPATQASQPQTALVASLQLAPETAQQLQHAVDARDFIAAEKLLLAEIDRDPHSARAARLLAFAGTVYFLNQDFMNAAIAWKKSAAVAPLDPKLRFSLAMAYIRMGHADWARAELQSLAALDGKAALYPYWLGRLDYDGHEYIRAIADFQQAIALDRGTEHPSPWPYLNLGITEQFLNQPAEAEKDLREAIRLDAGFAKAHFQLGTVLEDEQKPEAARDELKEAARLDASYAEPHMALARVYHKLGQEEPAREEVKIYLRLHPHSTP